MSTNSIALRPLLLKVGAPLVTFAIALAAFALVNQASSVSGDGAAAGLDVRAAAGTNGRIAGLQEAVRALATTPGLRVHAVSKVVETPAWKLDGVDHDAPGYLNAVVIGSTTLDPEDLLAATSAIERALPRAPSSSIWIRTNVCSFAWRT